MAGNSPTVYSPRSPNISRARHRRFRSRSSSIVMGRSLAWRLAQPLSRQSPFHFEIIGFWDDRSTTTANLAWVTDFFRGHPAILFGRGLYELARSS